MKYVWLGFHIIMAIALIAAFTGAFAPARSGNLMHDGNNTTGMVVGLIAIWIVGSIILGVIRKFSRY